MTVQRIFLSDEQLWRGIADNTNTMSALVEQQLKMAAVSSTANDSVSRANLVQSNAETISKLQRQYTDYTAELRRRYPSVAE
jgi:hypothetical protein